MRVLSLTIALIYLTLPTTSHAQQPYNYSVPQRMLWMQRQRFVDGIYNFGTQQQQQKRRSELEQYYHAPRVYPRDPSYFYKGYNSIYRRNNRYNYRTYR